MFESQRSAYKLQEKMNWISTEEFAEIQRLSNPDVMSTASEYYDYFARQRQLVHEKYNKRRNRAIWWSLHANGVAALFVIVALIVIGVVFFFS